jgi:uncharacterized protein (TIGR00255 family)
MTLSSMTGFARITGSHDGVEWHWEIKSVNGRNFDARIRLPLGFDSLESRIRATLAKYITRGNCQLTLTLPRQPQEGALRINEEALARALTAINRIAREIKVRQPTAEGILALRGVVEATHLEPDSGKRAELEDALLQGFESAALLLSQARQSEGAQLADIILAQLDKIEILVKEAEALDILRPENLKARLQAQLDMLLDARADLPQERLAQEIALLTTKSDVREEMDRLKSHIEAARGLLVKNGPVGRQLDFLAQEFNREANTLCAKAVDVALTRIGIELKTTVDQFREQIQNVE